MSSVSVALVDGHPITIEGLAHVLAAQGTFTVVGCGGSAREALAIAEQHRPKLMILDLAIPGDAISAISDMTARYPEIGVVAFTAASGLDYAVNAMEAGARGYVSKSCPPDELVGAVRAVAAGNTYVSQNFAGEVITALRNASVRRIAMQALRLSAREDQIVQFLLAGKTNKEIASHLGITERTVKHYMTVLMQKLNARNRVEVVVAAQKLRRDSIAQPDPALGNRSRGARHFIADRRSCYS
ncbi:LuxR C-terminal-related transcriptional regulator [Microvirga splendida]|uniref:Response regulator transcription factor n=1 Tax=Microvirga splendida TaxID=2795727 RepID=A0ABS0Y6I1_9HYPH|nr:response regulator transcription factor [Microvirga splendida]MBJ6127909.1 response regulator transcription factor [Microvirga splendida]